MVSSQIVEAMGGMNTVRSKIGVANGTLTDCQNFEVGVYDGYARIDGFTRTDGRVIPTSPVTFRITKTNAFITGWNVGDTVWWPRAADLNLEDSDNDARSFGVIQGVEDSYITVLTYIRREKLYSYSSVYNGTTDTEVTGTNTIVETYGLTGTQLQQNTEYGSATGTQRNAVNALYGSSLTRIPGCFFFQDRIYVAADLLRVNFSTGNIGSVRDAPPEGDTISWSGLTYGTVVQIVTESGAWPSGDAAGYMLISPSRAISFAVGDSLEFNAYSHTCEITAFSDVTKATLWYADYNGAGGWNAVTMPRRIGFRQTLAADPSGLSSASAFFLPYARRALSSALTAPTSTAILTATVTADLGGGSSNWTSVNNAMADDGAVAISLASDARTQSTEIELTEYELSTVTIADLIPAASVILGIEVEIDRYLDPIGPPVVTTESAYDLNVTLTGLTGAVENKANAHLAWPTVGLTKVTYGGPTDRWGNELDVDEVRSTGFGVRFSTKIEGATANSILLKVDAIRVKVYYQPQTTKVYIRNVNATSPTDIECTVVHRVVDSGDPTGATPGTATTQNAGAAIGEIFVTGLGTDQAKTRLIGINEEIRTASGGGGSLIAVTTSADTPLTLPSAYDLDLADTRYISEIASPYAGANTEVAFVANGVDRAFLLDGEQVVPIGTGFARNYEKPAFLTYWDTGEGPQLVLGYENGTVILSEYGNPVGFQSTASGFDSYDASDAVTGLKSLKGGPLMIMTLKSIRLRYSATETKTFSKASGGLPYSLCDMGQPVFTDFRGINTMANVQEFGDFVLGKISDPIGDQMARRLQAPTDPKRFIAALPVRAKSQYRQFYYDGTVYTCTLRPGQPPQFTKQLMHYNGENQPFRVLALCEGTTSDGRDVMFFTMGNKPFAASSMRYVFQLDEGRTFDGYRIFSHITFNPVTEKSPVVSVKWDSMVAFGAVTGFCTLTMYRASNYQVPTTLYGQSLVIGDSSETGVQSLVPRIGQVDLSIDGRDVSIKIAHSSNDYEGPFVIQAMELRSIQQEDRKR